MDLSMNQCEGPVTGDVEINLSQQNLVGVVPFDSICGLQSLEKIDLGGNSLYGGITAELKNCTRLQRSLRDFSLEINTDLTSLAFSSQGHSPFDSTISCGGEIPSRIVKLKKLWQLELYNNSFTGKLPVGFGNLTSLKNLDVSQNKLEDDLSELRFLNRLVSLHFFENEFSGEIPVEFGDFKNLNCSYVN
ncbi:hypothetical protein Patl1_37256 [Pistacia atlantica]|nr:hypothetical protein Patl1_37256 [Pistacia atlantica]